MLKTLNLFVSVFSKMCREIRFITRAGVIAVSLLLFCGIARAEKFVVAWAAVSALNSPFWVMNDAGFLKQEGLDIDFVYIASSPTVARATLAGDLAISASNGQVIVDAGLNGADLIAIGAVTNVVAFYVMAHPEIKTVADLKGKAVGVTRFGAATDFGMRILLNKYGLEPIKDVPLVQIGGMPELTTALTKKAVLAAPMSQPMAYVVQQAGLKMIANLAKEGIPFMHLGFLTTRKFIREHRPQAKSFLRAYGKSIQFMYTHKEETRAIFARYTKIQDLGMLDGSIQYAFDFMEKIPLVKAQAFQVTLDQAAKNNPKAKQAKPEQFFDNSLVQELVDEGFFTKLWGRNP